MAFFKRKEKNLAKRSDGQLRQYYETTENRLSVAANSGRVREVKKAMREHHTAEYAMLYKKVAQAKKQKARVVKLPQRNKRR